MVGASSQWNTMRCAKARSRHALWSVTSASAMNTHCVLLPCACTVEEETSAQHAKHACTPEVLIAILQDRHQHPLHAVDMCLTAATHCAPINKQHPLRLLAVRLYRHHMSLGHISMPGTADSLRTSHCAPQICHDCLLHFAMDLHPQ